MPDLREARPDMIRILIKFLAVLPMVLGGAYACVYAVLRDRCMMTVLTEAMSPSGTWKAVVNEEFCENPILTTITASVHLISPRDETISAVILGVSAHGADEDPSVVWTAPQTLQVDVPGSTYLKVLRCQFEGVQINIRLPPEDAAHRAAWYRQLGKPDPDPSGALAKKCP